MMGWMSQFLSNLASHGSSFLSSYYGDYVSASGSNLLNIIGEFFLNLAWSVISLVMFIMDMLEYIAFSFLGIDMGINDFTSIAERINIDVLLDTFRAILGLAIVLMIIFTIIAIVKQEWSNAASGFNKTNKDGKPQETNPKTPFITKMLKNLVFMFVMPLLVYFMFAGVTSVLNSFNLALKQNQNSTIAGQVLASSTYEANKYRMYALSGQRIPIIINAYDDSDANYDNIDEMAIKIQSMEVQNTLRGLATNFANNSFSGFSDTIVVKNNNLYNTSEYSALHEQFVCTPEQYQVMADFVDYAQQSNLIYYIKSLDDPNIEWKYVSSAIYNQSTNELSIEYVDANIINGGYASAAALTSDNTYSITYTPATGVTSPISDALESIKAMLGIDEYGDNIYNVMDRDEGYTNLVTWASEKAWLELSDSFVIDNRSTWTDTDEILIYEFYRWKYNNVLRDYTLDDLKNGIEWDVQLISYKDYYENLDIYSEEKYLYCIELNKNYYIVNKNEALTDNFGNAYYELTSHEDENMTFLKKSYTTVEENGTFTLKLSSNPFNINDYSSWNYQDQIIIYEYFADETYHNTLRQYNFDDFQTGVNLKQYKITDYDENGNDTISYCVLLNNTYYKLNGSKSAILDTGEDLLTLLEDNINYVYYHYNLDDSAFASGLTATYGLKTNLAGYLYYGYNVDSTFIDLDLSQDAEGNYLTEQARQDSKYENFTLKLSSNFSYSDTSTWSFRDVLVFYLYNKGYGLDTSYLKKYGVKGEVGRVGLDYCFKIKENDDGSYVYLKIKEINAISTEGIYKLDVQTTLGENVFTYAGGEALLYYDVETDKVIRDEASTYHFEFSDSYRAYDDSTWTIEDFILTYASEAGLIDSIANIKVDGYDALIYSYGTTRYYRFGNDVSTALFLKETISDSDISYFLKQSLSAQTYYDTYKGRLFEKDGLNDYYADHICSSWFSKDSSVVDYVESGGVNETFKFSGTFEASNLKTWKQADFLLYYMIQLVYGTSNVQKYIDGGVTGEVVYLVSSNRYGSSKVQKAIKFGSSNVFISYDALNKLYERRLAYYSISDTGAINYEIKLSEHTADIVHKIASSSGIASFAWTDYYYYQTGASFNTLLNQLNNVSDTMIKAVEELNMDEITSISSINLRLLQANGDPVVAEGDTDADAIYKMKAFLKSPENWTIIDFIVLREYSKNTPDGDFEGMTFKDLCTLDNFVNVYQIGTDLILETNGSYYNLKDLVDAITEIVTVDGEEVTRILGYECSNKINSRITASTAGNYAFKVPYENVSFSINPQIKYVINQTEFTVAFERSDGAVVYITPHDGTKIAYQQDLDKFDKYSVSALTRKVSWPQKLMNDMLVMYPDLNWSTLLATGNWVDVLGDYVSSYTNGMFVTEGNSSNITAVGMVLSEFFISCADESILGYADYEYSSLFDEDIIKSLMLSLLGEDEYVQLAMQADIFVELFNTTFAPILDDIAAEEMINIAEGDAVNLSIFVYKAFLATQLLSSDLGEYLYTVANRVYAQYTIYESLASAAGKYVEYDQYMNGKTESLILQIGSEYYDITSFVEEINPQDRLTFKAVAGLDVTSLLLNPDANSTHLKLVNEANSGYQIKIRYSEGADNTILDLIIDNELLDTSENNVLYGKADKLKPSGDGVSVNIYVSKSDVLLGINGNYYKITDYVTNNGDLEISVGYQEYLENISNDRGENLIEIIFDSSTFTPSTYAVTEAQMQGAGAGEYKINVQYSSGYNSESTMTVLDKIIKDYVDKMYIGGTYDDEPLYNHARKFKKQGTGYSIFADVYVISNENAFTYSTFEELVKYENKALTNINSTPMYTFNMQRVYKLFKEQDIGHEYTDPNEWQTIWADVNSNDSNWHNAYVYCYDKLNNYYNHVYLLNNGRIYDDDPYYCYLYEVYYSIRHDCESRKEDLPTYLNIYKDYLDGNIVRWNILAKEDISASSTYIPDYYNNKSSMLAVQIKAIVSFASLFRCDINYTGNLIDDVKSEINEGGGLGDILSAAFDNVTLKNFEGFSPKSLAEDSGLSSSMTDDYQNVFGIFEANTLIGKVFQALDVLSLSEMAQITELFLRSAAGDRGAWTGLIKVYNSLSNIIDEFNAIKDLYYTGEDLATARTEKGSKVATRPIAGTYYDETSYDDALKVLTSFYEKLGDFITLQRTLDVTVKSSITFTLAQYGKDYVTNYRFNLENRGYTFSSMASPLRLAEYVMGGSFLVDYGIYPAFTSVDFDGIIHRSKVYDAETGIMKTKLDMWPELKEFAANLAAYTAKLYYTTNLCDLAENVQNAVYLTDILLAKDGTGETTIEFMILKYLGTESDISAETLCRLMLDGTGLGNNAGVADILDRLETLKTQAEDAPHPVKVDKTDVLTILTLLKTDFSKTHIAFKNVISYLLLSEEQVYENEQGGIYFENMTFTDFKKLLMDRLIEYQANPSEQADENINRYLALFYLICAEVDYYDGSTYVGTNLAPINVYNRQDGVEIAVAYVAGADAEKIYFNNDGVQGNEVIADFKIDEATKISLLEMSNCDNKPIEDLVQMEYESLYNRTDGVYDENLGDVFVICIYDEMLSKYIPVLAKNFDTSVADSGYHDYVDTYHHVITTDYYADSGRAYPIIAKGIITAGGLPTAIRIVNGEVKFYRTTLTATVNVNESAVLNSMYSSELTTIGYTTYVPATMYLPFGDTNKMVKFIGDVNIGTIISSDFSAYFLQTDMVYNFESSDDLGGFVVLDNMAAHYQIGTQVIFMMFLGFVILFPLVFRLSVSAMRRILDLIFLCLSYPLLAATSTLSLEDGKNNPLNSWTDKMKKTLLSVFGYIIGFNCYYILVSSIMKINFVDVATVESIKSIGGFGFVSLSTLNMIVRYLFLIEAVAIIKGSMNMLLPMITGGSVTNALASALDDKDTVGQMKSVVDEAKNLAKKASAAVTGEALIQAKDAAIESVKSMLPGASIVGSIKEDVQGIASKVKANALKNAALEKGVSPAVANKLAKSYRDNAQKQRTQKRQMRIDNANKFMSNYANDFKPAKFEQNKHLLPEIKKAFAIPKSEKKNDKGKSKKK